MIRYHMNDAPRPEHLPAGYDEEDPYEGEVLETYPDWWQESIELFRDHNMRPYRPSRFSDGVNVPSLIEELSKELGVSIMFRAFEPETSEDWDILVDGKAIKKVGRHREPEGFTKYHIDSKEFESIVRNAVEDC
jgi:hypothetical protein